MIFEHSDLANAVYVFSEERELFREMTYAEYEAQLDGYVPATDLADRELNAVYVEVNSSYRICNAVFFLMRFNSSGFVDHTLSVPLFKLAQHARKGPDLGAGPIGLACASQCPIKHLGDFLWDPDLRTKHEFKVLCEAVSRNRVSIQFREPDPEVVRREKESESARKSMEDSISSRLRKEYDKEMRDHMAQVIREQRLKANMILRERENAITELKQQYNSRIEEYRTLVEEQKSMLKEAREQNSQLKATIDGQAEKITGLREYFEHKLEKAESVESSQLEELKRSHAFEIEAAVEIETRELRELLQKREVEILYHNDQEAKLHEEVERLRREIESLITNSGDQILDKMLESGISFVTYQPGAGHITLPVSEIPKFMGNPVAYVAEHCGVSEKHYNAWHEHYLVPVCQAITETGEMCGANISRVEVPVDFIIDESDRCQKHRIGKTSKMRLASSKWR